MVSDMLCILRFQARDWLCTRSKVDTVLLSVLLHNKTESLFLSRAAITHLAVFISILSISSALHRVLYLKK